MLDDLKYIHQRDGQDALGVAEKQWQQLQHSFQLSAFSFQPDDITNVVYAGMGGSALPAQLIYAWAGLKLPLIICRNYDVPDFVDQNTLFIAASYSGNTEEELAALAAAENRGAKIAVMASGGKLAELAVQKQYPLAKLPAGYQPRYTAFFGLRALCTILAKTGLIDEQKVMTELDAAANFLGQAVAKWRPDVPTAQNPTKQTAQELAGKSVVVYAGPKMSAAAYKWKISLNENAKNVAWWNQIPEFNHNEMIGWSSHPVDKPYAVVELRSNLENPRVMKRFEISEKLLSGQRPAPHIINVEGDSVLKQLVWAVAYGDFTSIYLALLNGVNPTPVELIDKFKFELNK